MPYHHERAHSGSRLSILLVTVLCLTPMTLMATPSKGMVEWIRNQFQSQALSTRDSSDYDQAFPLLLNPEGFEDGYNPLLYGFWQEVNLHPSTGAICGNGTPYKFYIRQAWGSDHMSINLEPGGACWNYDSCTGKTGIRGAANPNGIPERYMNKIQTAWMTPFLNKFHWKEHFDAQRWNTVFLPYCTGDVHSGDKVVTYVNSENPEEKIVWHHKGMRNVLAAIAWIKQNLQTPERMLTTGCSAGGTGSLVNYYWFRKHLNPERSYMLNDSGPIYLTQGQGPSLPLHKKIRSVWGFDPIIEEMKHNLPNFDEHDLGTLVNALSAKFHQDRLAITQYYQDLNYSSYSYERFYSDIYNDPDKESRQQKILDRWHTDIESMVKQLDQLPNFAYYIPHYRALNESHCTTIVEFNGSDIQENPTMPELRDFIDQLLDDEMPLQSAIERDTEADYNKPFNPFYALLNKFLE